MAILTLPFSFFVQAHHANLQDNRQWSDLPYPNQHTLLALYEMLG